MFLLQIYASIDVNDEIFDLLVLYTYALHKRNLTFYRTVLNYSKFYTADGMQLYYRDCGAQRQMSLFPGVARSL